MGLEVTKQSWAEVGRHGWPMEADRHGWPGKVQRVGTWALTATIRTCTVTRPSAPRCMHRGRIAATEGTQTHTRWRALVRACVRVRAFCEDQLGVDGAHEGLQQRLAEECHLLLRPRGRRPDDLRCARMTVPVPVLAARACVRDMLIMRMRVRACVRERVHACACACVWQRCAPACACSWVWDPTVSRAGGGRLYFLNRVGVEI